MAQKSHLLKLRPRQLLLLLLLALAIYVLVPQLKSFHVNWQSLAQSSRPDLTQVVLFSAVTYVAAAASYVALAFRRLRVGRTVTVQFASMFANRLLPAGTGTIGTNYAYLRKAGQTPAQAASMVAVNNSLGFIGNMLLVIVVLLVWHRQLPNWHRPDQAIMIWTGVASLIIILAVYFAGSRWRRRLAEAGGHVIKQILTYRRRPGRLALALLACVVVTLGNVVAFYFSTRAVGVHVSLAACLLVLTVGVGVGTATPTPGGLGGVEAGLVAGLVAYHIPDVAALTAVILYRLISYWLALLAGAGAFVYAEQRGYF